jgi:cell division septum initiation protein DivIVA
MTGSEMRGNEAGRAVEAEVARYADQASVELSAAQASEAGTVGEAGAEQAPRRLGGYRINHGDRTRLIAEAREIHFPVAMRGYERGAVDRYVKEVNRLIAELEMTSSPESAVRRALEEVSEETRDLLQRAHQTAEDITARSRVKADDRLRQAEEEAQAVRQTVQRDADATREAAQSEADSIRDDAQREAHELRAAAQHESAALREIATREATELRETSTREATELRDTASREAHQARTAAKQDADRLIAEARREAEELLDGAETRARELAQNAGTIWRERRRLIEDIRAIGEQLVTLGEAEAKRFPHLAETLPAVMSASHLADRPEGKPNGSSTEANGGRQQKSDPVTDPQPVTEVET